MDIESLSWSPNYSVGHPVLDAQHQQLLSLCKKAALSLDDDSPQGREIFHDILNDLTAYVRDHFQTEERLLDEANYPLLEQHRAIHIAYENRLGELLMSATEGVVDKVALSHYLSEWWTDHILCSDKQYSASLNR